MQLPLAAACWREPSRSPRAFAQALVPSLGQFVRDWLAAKVPDVQAACARFEDLGVAFQKRLSDGRMKNIAFIRDPDDYWVEIISNTPYQP